MRCAENDGPWSLSVAESPYDPHCYSIYVKSPTHNLTLSRTATELVHLHHKLRNAHPIPPLPHNLPLPPKRKSTFLNTLSRLASPGHNRHPPQPSTMTATVPPPSPAATALAAYLTSIANVQSVKADRLWKRFVRVRTDDLQSVRVERAIKRVRSDLPAHSLDTPTPADPTPTDVPPRPSTPPPQPLPRSHSADPDKAHRISRSFIPDDSLSSLPPPESSFIAIDPGFVSATTTNTTSASENGDPKPRPKKPRKSDASRSKSKSHRKVCIDDFEMLRVLGKGCAGKVLLVRHKVTSDLFALKAITKRHVLAHQELQHTLTEQAVLKRMAAESRDPFVVRLWWSFHDKENLFLVMDFHPGGDLATQLARWGRLGRDRARFYAAEIVEGVEGLHAAGVIYRDLKPENILIGGDGHIVLTDFGLSKEFPRVRSHASPIVSGGHTHPHGPHGTSFYSSVPGTPLPTSPPWMQPDRNGDVSLGWGWPGTPSLSSPTGSVYNGSSTSDMTKTFCGTAEYLAPEVIQGLPYSYEVDWWSFGTMLYEMLTGITPFWANNHDDMYVRVLQDELHFPDDRAIDQDTKSLIRGLLQRVPSLRICEPRIKKHPYFSMIDWSHVYYKRYIPPYIPPIDPSNASDTQNFDDTFLDMEPVLDEYQEEIEAEGENDNELEGRRRLDHEPLTDVDTDQEPQTDGVDTEGGGTGTEGDRTDADEDLEGTPSQSRSSSVMPSREIVEGIVNGSPIMGRTEDDVDVFDGYSFKGRHSVLLEDEDEGGSSEGSYYEGEGDVEREEVKVLQKDDRVVVEDEEEEGRKTPEARPVGLPSTPESQPVVKDVEEQESQKVEEEVVSAEGAVDGHEATVPVGLDEAVVPPPVPPKPPSAVPGLATATPASIVTTTTTRSRTRKERSGVPALDRYLSDTIEERASDASASENESEDEDDDWDLIEKGDGEDRNGLGGLGGGRVGRGVGVGMRVRMKGGNLFARGVVDRYRLKVFGNKSSSGAAGSGGDSNSVLNTQSRGRRVVSGMSVISGRSFGSSTFGGTNGGSPVQKKEQKQKEKEERRGRTPLTFKKHPREFLRAKSPRGSTATIATTATSKTSVMAGGSPSTSGYNTVPVSAASSLAGILLTPSHSISSYRFDKDKETPHVPNTNTTSSPGSPSLKSKESAMSVGGQSGASSDQSTNGPYVHVEVPDASASELMLGLGMTMNPKVNMSGKKTQQLQQRRMKLKKYKNNAEKVLSLFSSPKGGGQQQQHVLGQGGLGPLNSNSNFVQQGVSVQNVSNAQVEDAQSQLGQQTQQS